MIKKELLINISHAKQMAEDGLLKEYSVFLYFKSKYKNSCIYNFSYKKVSSIYKISRSAAKKYISFFLEKGWCKIHCGNLVFCKLKHIDDVKSKNLDYIQFNTNGKVKDVIYDLRLKILQLLQTHFNKLKQVRRDYYHADNFRTFRKAKKLIKRIGVKISSLPSETDQLTISLLKLSKMFDCSKTSAFNMINSFKMNNDVLCIGGEKKVIMKTDNPLLIKNALTFSGYYYGNGRIYKTSCNKYIF